MLISGSARHGKDTFADGLSRIVSELRGDEITFQKGSFATALKQKAMELGWDGKKDDRGRKFLQDFGSVCRQNDGDIWIKLLYKSFEGMGFPPFLAVPDCRYPNEISRGKEWGERNGYLVKTVRIYRPYFENGLSDEAKSHSSETALNRYPFDLVLYNEAKSPEEFQEEAFRTWEKAFPEVVESTQAEWDMPVKLFLEAPVIHGDSDSELRTFRQGISENIITLDFDDTLLEKTGAIDRAEVFKKLCGGARIVIVTARSGQIGDIHSFLQEKGIEAAGIVYAAGEKGHVLNVLKPVCHFDDDPGVAEHAFPMGIPVFAPGEFSSPAYRRLWVARVREMGEEGFYLAHSGKAGLEDLAVRREGKGEELEL